MSDTNQDKTVRTPRLTIDQSAAPAGEVVDPKVEGAESHDAVADDFDEAMGLIKGTGAAIWSYAVRHPNTTLGPSLVLCSPCWCSRSACGIRSSSLSLC